MRKGRYPLEPVLAQRGLAYQEAEIELARARGRLHDAQLALQAAEEARAAHTAKRSRVVTPAPESRHVSSQALAWTGAYAARLQAEGLKLTEQVNQARAAVATEARAVRLAELSWQRAYTDRELLQRHHDRFRESERKAVERAEELEEEERAHHAYRSQVRT